MYIRKTKDEWGVWGLYDGEWSLETSAESRRDALRLLKEYEENCPDVCFTVKCIRVKLSDEEYQSLKAVAAKGR